MKRIKNLALGVLAALALAPMLQTQITQAAPFGSAFTYQGRLNFSGSPASNGLYDFRFELHSDATVVALVGSAVTLSAVPVTNGLFTVSLDFGAAAFTSGEARWLRLQVATNGFTPLTALNPRQRLTPTPQAIYAGTAATAATAATASAVAAGAVTSSGLAPGSVGGPAIADGSITSADLNSSLLNNTFWKLVGNAGTTPAANFFGTTDDQPVEFRVNGGRALRLEPSLISPNVIGGLSSNKVSNGAIGATIGGGGYRDEFNMVGGNYGTVSGGRGNTANNAETTVAGGRNNTASGGNSVVSGGYANLASGTLATVAGGLGNVASGNYGFVAGGTLNAASHDYTFAAGHRAKADHAGSFVWADPQPADFVSTSSNQFLIRASGGVGIGTANPARSLEIRGETASGPSLRLTGVGGFGSKVGIDLATYDPGVHGVSNVAARIEASDNNWSAGIDFQTKAPGDPNGAMNSRLFIQNDGNVGIGMSAPSEKLHVVGNILASGSASVCALTIRGGCDLAEPFQMSGQDLPKGAVVVIDDTHPGHLRLSESAYDTRVAGIISGANGVNPGISLHQEGVMEGGQNVALSGRVYVQADASNGAIKPGDLLTTSATPGHAMKVATHGKAQGAILGKAMSALDQGTGMVLVLVSLQ